MFWSEYSKCFKWILKETMCNRIRELKEYIFSKSTKPLIKIKILRLKLCLVYIEKYYF